MSTNGRTLYNKLKILVLKNDDLDKKFTPETPFSTRHFTVFFDKEGKVDQTFTESIYAIDEDTVVEYAEKVMDGTLIAERRRSF